MEGRPSLLVVGGPGVGKKSILAAILGVEPGQLTSSSSHVWQLDTKYYTAEVDVRCHRVGELHPDQSGSHEAVVLVFDASESDSLAAVQVWSKAADLDSTEIRLCVANKVDLLGGDGEFVRDNWLDDGAQWCLGELFEYVEVSATEAAVNAALEYNEDHGLQRVRSALEAHTWPGLKLKERAVAGSHGMPGKGSNQEETPGRAATEHSAPRAGSVPGEDANPGNVRTGEAACSVPVEGGDEENAPGEHGARSRAEECGREANAETGGPLRVLNQARAAGQNQLFTPAAVQKPPPGGTPVLGLDAMFAPAAAGEAGEEQGLDTLLAEFSGARTRLQELPDEQRREQAGAMAMRLMSMFGLDGSDDGGESSADEDSSDDNDGAAAAAIEAAPAT